MNAHTMMIDYPAELPDTLQESRESFEREARLAMAVKLFERGRLPSGVAAKLAGMDRVTFLLCLRDHGVPMVSIPPDELREDIANARP